MSTKYRLQEGMWIRNPDTGEQGEIQASNDEFVAIYIDNRQRLCYRNKAIRIHPPIWKSQPVERVIRDWIRPTETPQEDVSYTWVTTNQTTGVTHVNPVTYSTVYNVSTASS